MPEPQSVDIILIKTNPLSHSTPYTASVSNITNTRPIDGKKNRWSFEEFNAVLRTAEGNTCINLDDLNHGIEGRGACGNPCKLV